MFCFRSVGVNILNWLRSELISLNGLEVEELISLSDLEMQVLKC